MTTLADRVHVGRRFRRSIRIDTDLADPTALEGFVCPPSSAAVLQTMAKHVVESEQTAFTWTGPYGTGKSSLVVALSAALNGSSELREITSSILGAATTETLWDALPPRTKGWRILPVVGRRDRPAQVVGEAIERSRLLRNSRIGPWSDDAVFDALTRISRRAPKQYGGVIVFIDEMGKFLEGAAYDGTDIYFFQQLAEIASRSNNRLMVVGILHQAFEEYAYRLSRDMRDEWAKIQGRFVDLAISVGPDEQLELLGRAIVVEGQLRESSGLLAKQVSAMMHRSTPPRLLENCWPLHPITACLLGPISRRRFGQNQRSLFSFLNSTEPLGFQDYLQNSTEGDLYAPEILWDYLRVNLEPSIIASPDGHRWATAVDALERCHGSGGDDLQIRLLKVIALVDLFKERSGLVASSKLLCLTIGDRTEEEIREALERLEGASLVIFRKFNNSYSIFEGSDFDIEHAVDEAYETVGDIDFSRLTVLAGLQPVIAKRHYHKTGAIRWFETSVVPLRDVKERASTYLPKRGAVGAFMLALPSQGDSPRTVATIADTLIAALPDGVVVGIPEETTWRIESLARELLALEQVRDTTPELRGDRVARLEIETRIAEIQGQVESELSLALDSAVWRGRGLEPRKLEQAELNSVASELADARFGESPRLKNELLNRIRPSSNAVAAQNALLRRMALHEGRVRLGIVGYPAEGGLFASLLESTGLYRKTFGGWKFVAPKPEDDLCNLLPAWEAATRLLEANSHRAVSIGEIYEVWRDPPFGIKDGLLPILAVAFTLSKSHTLAFYRQGVFRVRMTDLDTDYLAKDPDDIQLRWMDMSNVSRGLLSDLADIVRDIDPENTLPNLEPIDVARGLVAIYDQLPAWVGRTQRLSSSAKRVRHMFKQAKDPNRLIFDDMPLELGDGNGRYGEENVKRISHSLREALTELRDAYPSMLHRLRELLLSELHVPNASPPMLADLRSRASNVVGIGGDHRLEAFIIRLARFDGTYEDMESLASMAANKPPGNWVDADVDGASVELANLAQRFMHLEAFARVKGRVSKRHAIAIVVGTDGRPTPFHEDFEIGDLERPEVDALVAQLDKALDDIGMDRRNVVLAALAELSARYLGDSGEPNMADTQQPSGVAP